MENCDRAFAAVKEAIKTSNDPEFTPEVKQKVAEKLNETQERFRGPLDTDKVIYRCVVVFLGLAILGSLACTFFIFFRSLNSPDLTSLKIPDIFLAIGSAAVGALAGLLAPSPGRGTNV
jgi:hypothetical protein